MGHGTKNGFVASKKKGDMKKRPKDKPPSKAVLKREFLALKLKSSYGGVSTVTMNEKGEDMIIQMLALLESKDRAALGTEQEQEISESIEQFSDCDVSSDEDDYSGSQSDEDEYLISSMQLNDVDDVDDVSDESVCGSDNEESNDDEPNQQSNVQSHDIKTINSTKVGTVVTIPEPAKMKSRHQFVRQLIRDDRYESRQDELEKDLARRDKYQKSLASAEVAGNHSNSNSNSSAVSKLTMTKGPANKVLCSTVRLNIQPDKGGSSKLLVVARSMPLKELLQLARSKFNVTAKFNGLVAVASGEELEELDLLSIADDSHLRLCSLKDLVRAATRPPADKKHVQIKDEVVEDAEGEIKVENPVQPSRSGTDRQAPVPTPEVTYWTPPSSSAGSEHQGDSNMARIIPDTVVSARLRSQVEALYSSESYAEMRTHRESLPIFKARDDLLHSIRHNQVVVVSGETGSGKTTQLPLYIFEDMCAQDRGAECYIVCTQPRRIAAITVAERVAVECNVQQKGTSNSRSGNRSGSSNSSIGDLVGYQIRLDNKCSAQTRILYCTTGVLLRKLQQPGFLSKVSHVILDEVHERQVETDFLMTLLKQQRASVPALRMVLMSATMQENLFTSYFEDCPLVSVSGRTFPVVEHYLEEVHRLIAQGQKMTAAERGKISSSEDYSAGGSENGSTSKNKQKSKKDQLQSNLLSITAPRFDADIVAELVLRIITTHSKPKAVVGSAPSQHNTNSSSASAGGENVGAAPVSSRMLAIQRAAGRSSSQSDSATAVPTNPTSSSSVAVTPTNCEKGDAILVFLSGIQAIERVSKAIRQRNVLQRLNAEMFILHGSMPPEQQRKVFRTTLPGQWKIVLATNIAETSITVDDVTHVVDTGFVKEMRYDPVSNISSLQEVFVSRAAARQRAGRAGRVRAGHCWKMYTGQYFSCDRVEEYSLPEIQRIPLEEVVLQVLLLKLGRPEHFLSQCLQSPSIEQVKASIKCLLEVGAILPLAELPLTALGYHLAKMPVDVRLGKMLIYSSLLKTVEPVLTIVAAIGGKSPFVSPPDQRGDSNKQHMGFVLTGSTNSYSDHLAVVVAYDAWMAVMQSQGNAAAYQFCRERYLSHSVLLDMQALREHFRSHLINAGFLPRPSDRQEGSSYEMSLFEEGFSGLSLNDSINQALEKHEAKTGKVSQSTISTAVSATSGTVSSKNRKPDQKQSAAAAEVSYNTDLVRCILCAGLAPQLVRLRKLPPVSRTGKSPKKFETGTEALQLMGGDRAEVSLHPSSLVQRFTRDILRSATGSDQKDAFLVYYKKIASTKVFLYDATVVPHVGVLLFGNSCHGFKINKKRDRAIVGGWIEMRVSELHAVLYKRLQQEIECVLRLKVENPSLDVDDRERDVKFIVETLLEGSRVQ